MIRSLRDEVGAVILAGGDGTLSAAAPALRDTGLPLGILPLGTANDLARTLAIPTGADGAAAVILAGHRRRLDLGCVNGHLFFNVASLGLSVEITQRLTRVMKRRWGRLAYPIAAAAVIMQARRFSATIRVDGQDIPVKSMQVAVGNGRHYGGGMVVADDAAIDDGRLDVYSLEPRARWRLLWMARAFRDGEHDLLEEVRTLRCRSLEVRTRRRRHVSADGEIITRTPARFTLLRKQSRCSHRRRRRRDGDGADDGRLGERGLGTVAASLAAGGVRVVDRHGHRSDGGSGGRSIGRVAGGRGTGMAGRAAVGDADDGGGADVGAEVPGRAGAAGVPGRVHCGVPLLSQRPCRGGGIFVWVPGAGDGGGAAGPSGRGAGGNGGVRRADRVQPAVPRLALPVRRRRGILGRRDGALAGMALGAGKGVAAGGMDVKRASLENVLKPAIVR